MVSSVESPGARGRVIAGKYKLVDLIGSGSMGVVWRAEHLSLGAPVALKLIHKKTGRAPANELARRFAREARAAAAVRGPHVAQILDHGVDGDVPYIALELLEGESLDIRLARERRISFAEAKRYVAHIARALTRAQEAGYIHRDLKPSNVFIVHNEGETSAKVLDFGLAKALAPELLLEDSALTEVGQILGTPTYMSPEQIRGKPLDHRSDLWSLGVIAYECVCGALPFDGPTVQDVMLAACNDAPPKPSQYDPVLAPAFDEWFAKAVDKDPERRFQSAKELADALALVEVAESVDLPIVGSFRPPRLSSPGLESTLMAMSGLDDDATVDLRPSTPSVPSVYDSAIDLEELTHFWEGASHSALPDAEKLTLRIGDRVSLRDGQTEIGPLLMLEVIQAVRDGHLSLEVPARPLGSHVWCALSMLRVVGDDGRALDLAELSGTGQPPAPPAAPETQALPSSWGAGHETRYRWILVIALCVALATIIIVLAMSR